MTKTTQAAVHIGSLTSPRSEGGGSPRLPRDYRAACLLLLIWTKPAHGYELRERLIEYVGAAQDVGQMYRTLRSLEKAGLVVSCWQGSEAGPARRTYHISERGTGTLEKLVEEIASGHRLTGEFLDRYNRAVRHSKRWPERGTAPVTYQQSTDPPSGRQHPFMSRQPGGRTTAGVATTPSPIR